MTTKVCSKCKKELDISCFYKNKSKPGGITTQCKYCCKKYNKENKDRDIQYHRIWYKENSERILKQQKQYYKDNIKERLDYDKRYYKDNIVRVATRNSFRMQKSALFELYYKKLIVFEEIRKCNRDKTLLEVRCVYCGKWMVPTNLQVQSRIQVFEGQMKGECRFYCSKNCKISCPIYGQINYPKGFKKATSREVVPLLRQLVLERDNYTCQKCWATTETAQLHVHHEKSYTLNKIMANDPDNCITLCKNCHKWTHSQEGCKYNDLKC